MKKLIVFLFPLMFIECNHSNENTSSEKVFQINDSVGDLKEIQTNELKNETIIESQQSSTNIKSENVINDLDTISIMVDNVILFSKALDDMGLAEIKAMNTQQIIINKLSNEEIKGILLHIENQIINHDSLKPDNINSIFYYDEKPFDGVAKILDPESVGGTKYLNFKNGILNGRYFHTGIEGGYSYSGNYKNGKKHGRFIKSMGEGWGYAYVDYIDGAFQEYVFVDLYGRQTDNIDGKESFLIYLDGLQ
jgi:hypothetical protein